MPAISAQTIEEIKARIDLAELIGSYITVKRSGSGYTACCPFHHEKTPSFHIRPEQGYYHCFGCGESGDAFKFLEKHEGLTFLEAAKKLAAMCGITIEEKSDPQAESRKRQLALHAELAAFYRRCLLQANEAGPARAYVKRRALDGEVGERFLLGYAPKSGESMVTWAKKHKFTVEELQTAGVLRPPKFAGGSWYHFFGGRLVFPIRDRAGRTIAFSCRVLDKAQSPAKYVNSPETVLFHKSSVLYAFDQAAGEITRAPGRCALVCEGQIDTIRCHANGFRTAVASEGTSFTEEHVQILKKVADAVTLVFDGDNAGQKAGVRTGALFLAAGVPVRVATLPAGEDPDSFLLAQGPAAFQEHLDAAESLATFQVRTLLSKEKNPNSVDAVSRVSRAVLGVISQCPQAVVRETLLVDAAAALHLPVEALREDLLRVPPPKLSRSVVTAVSVTGVPGRTVADPNAFKASDEPLPYEERAVIPEESNAAASVNNPPPVRELTFCEFLFQHEHDTGLAEVLRACLAPSLFVHEFTAQFVTAWIAGATTAEDALVALRRQLSPEACAWLDHILMANEKTAFSELSPVRILQDYLRQFWMAAVQRRLGSLESVSTPENDRKRLELSLLVHTFERAPWTKAAVRMIPETLA